MTVIARSDLTVDRVTKLTGESGSTVYKYGLLGEVSEETRTINRLPLSGSQSKIETMRYTSDYFGSAQVMTNWRGQLHERLEYTPYGELWIYRRNNDAHEDGTPYRFTGKELNAETSLYCYRARYLDPKISRWLSGDPALVVIIMALLLLRTDTAIQQPINRNHIYNRMINIFDTYDDGISNVKMIYPINPKVSIESIKLSSNPMAAVGHSFDKGMIGPDGYDDGRDSNAGTMMNTISMPGDIRLERTKTNGSISWFIIEIVFNTNTGGLKNQKFSNEQALVYLIKNREKFTDEQYKDISRLPETNWLCFYVYFVPRI